MRPPRNPVSLQGTGEEQALGFFPNELQKELFHKGPGAADRLFADCNSYSCVGWETSSGLAGQTTWRAKTVQRDHQIDGPSRL